MQSTLELKDNRALLNHNMIKILGCHAIETKQFLSNLKFNIFPDMAKEIYVTNTFETFLKFLLW